MLRPLEHACGAYVGSIWVEEEITIWRYVRDHESVSLHSTFREELSVPNPLKKRRSPMHYVATDLWICLGECEFREVIHLLDSNRVVVLLFDRLSSANRRARLCYLARFTIVKWTYAFFLTHAWICTRENIWSWVCSVLCLATFAEQLQQVIMLHVPGDCEEWPTMKKSPDPSNFCSPFWCIRKVKKRPQTPCHLGRERVNRVYELCYVMSSETVIAICKDEWSQTLAMQK
jgi:hypothetical protein